MPADDFDEHGHPKVQEGFVRVYTDHTGRWYKDFTQEELDELANDPILKILAEEVQAELNAEFMRSLPK